MSRNFSQRRVTINDIARECGVSKSTVSEVINGNIRGRVRAETCSRIQSVIDKLAYRPSHHAQAMSSGHSRHLGVLLSSSAQLSFANTYFGSILSGIEHICSERNYFCTISLYDLSRLDAFITPPSLQSHSVDALFVMGEIGLENEQVSELLCSLRIPVFLLGNFFHDNFFCIDWENIYASSFTYLASIGHRNFLLPYYNESDLFYGQNELAAASQKLGLDLKGFFTADWKDIGDLSRGARLCDEVFSNSELSASTAIVANDQICSGFLQQMIKKGLQCPQDFSIVSACDTPTCEWNSLPISASGGNVFQYGINAANAAIDLLENKKKPEQVKCIKIKQPAKTKIRATSGKNMRE